MVGRRGKTPPVRSCRFRSPNKAMVLLKATKPYLLKDQRGLQSVVLWKPFGVSDVLHRREEG